MNPTHRKTIDSREPLTDSSSSSDYLNVMDLSGEPRVTERDGARMQTWNIRDRRNGLNSYVMCSARERLGRGPDPTAPVPIAYVQARGLVPKGDLFKSATALMSKSKMPFSGEEAAQWALPLTVPNSSPLAWVIQEVEKAALSLVRARRIEAAASPLTSRLRKLGGDDYSSTAFTVALTCDQSLKILREDTKKALDLGSCSLHNPLGGRTIVKEVLLSPRSVTLYKSGGPSVKTGVSVYFHLLYVRAIPTPKFGENIARMAEIPERGEELGYVNAWAEREEQRIIRQVKDWDEVDDYVQTLEEEDRVGKYVESDVDTNDDDDDEIEDIEDSGAGTTTPLKSRAKRVIDAHMGRNPPPAPKKKARVVRPVTYAE